MLRDTAMLCALIVVGAGWLVVHAALLIRTARAPGLSFGARALAWLPPATPIVSWRAGARGLAIAWALHAALYFALRSMA